MAVTLPRCSYHFDRLPTDQHTRMELQANLATSVKPIRVLHVLGRLDHGGVEVWLMNVLRHINRSEFCFDFAYTRANQGCLTPKCQLAANIFPLDPPRRRPLTYGSRLARLLTTNGPYDVVHSHVHFSSGFVLREAARLAIPNRIAHSHNDTRSLDQQSGWLRRLYRRTTSGWIHRYATTGLACSSWAAAALFGENWKADDRWKILRYGVDFSKFSQSRHRELFLQELGIPANRKIIGQIGRLAEQKNHRFSVQVLRELVAKGADVHLLIVGGGELEHLIRMQIQEAGLSERATMVGDQQDVASYLSVMDLMIFPSVHEGLGIVMLEAQAAGVPVVASDHVPGDGIVLPDLVEQLSLQAGMAAWADAIQDKMNAPTKDPAKTVALMSQSDFAISSSVEQLCRVYRGDYNKN